MKKKEEILSILIEETQYLKRKYGVRRIGLFGSYSRGKEQPESDIDLLIEFDRPIGFFKFIEVEDYLSGKLGAKVDLVTNDALKPIMRTHVMEDIVYV